MLFFLLQTILVQDIRTNLFFDIGSADLVVRQSAVEKLLRISRANLEFNGPIPIKGVEEYKTKALRF